MHLFHSEKDWASPQIDKVNVAYNLQKLFVEIDRTLSSKPMSSLGEITQQLHCSHPIIEKAVIKHTGQTFREYKNTKKLESAVRLAEKGYNLKYIALELGYEWPDNMTRFFKKVTRVSVSKLAQKRSIPKSIISNHVGFKK